MNTLTAEQRTKVNELEQVSSRFFEQLDVDSLRKEGIEVEIYFDTYYILSMIQGYWELATKVDSTDQKLFKSDRFLVQALAYFGYLKNIKMLRPHVAELYIQLGKPHLLPNERIRQREILNFLKSINLSDARRSSNLQFAKRVEQAPTMLKANYVLQEPLWTNRFNYLFNSHTPVIEFDTIAYPTGELMASSLFETIFQKLSSDERSLKTVNNLRDALSLCVLKKKIEAFETDKKKLPLIYLTIDVQEKLDDELLQHFTITHEGRTINTIKDTEYMVLDAIFGDDIYEQEEKFFAELKRLKRSFLAYREIGERFPQANLNSLVKKWHQYKNHDFFEKIWNDEKTGRMNLEVNLKAFLQDEQLPQSDEEQTAFFEKERSKLQRDLLKRISDLVFIEDIWQTLGTLDVLLKHLVNPGAVTMLNDKPDIFRDGGLTRFSPPSGKIQHDVEDLWTGFLDNAHIPDSQSSQRLKVRLTRLLYEGTVSESKVDHDKILTGICILWMFSKYELIIKTVEKLDNDYGKRYQIALIYLASLLKTTQRFDAELKKIDDTIACLREKKAYQSNYKLWIGLGYVYFNVWNTYTQAPSIPELRSFSPPTNRFDHYRDEGIRLLKQTFEYLRGIRNNEDEKALYRNVKYYYTLNSYVYYVIRGSSLTQFNEPDFHDYVSQLENVQSNLNYRQARIYDTLGHYYFRMAKNAEDDSAKESFLKTAERNMARATDLVVIDVEQFEVIKNQIQVYLEEVQRRIKRAKPAEQ